MLFGMGLIVSGMGNPAKIINFLDVTGTFDPSMALVMIGAIAVVMPGFKLLRGRDKPIFAQAFNWPSRTDIDMRLIAGSSLFGIGWGLSGYCPGPGIVGLPQGESGTIAFMVAMLVGMSVGRYAADAQTLFGIGRKGQAAG